MGATQERRSQVPCSLIYPSLVSSSPQNEVYVFFGVNFIICNTIKIVGLKKNVNTLFG